MRNIGSRVVGVGKMVRGDSVVYVQIHSGEYMKGDILW